MTIRRSLIVKNSQSSFDERVCINDIIRYEIDLNAWQSDNSVVSSVDWLSSFDGASITNQNLANGIASALLNFTQSGLIKVKITLNAGTIVKNIWLNIKVCDISENFNEHGGYGS